MQSEIEADTAALVEIVELILSERPISDWPNAAQSVLSRALSDERAPAAEAAKAECLRRHLFGDLPSPSFAERGASSRQAERVRADLPGIVPFGSGFHLADPVALARSWMRTHA